jgi:hypothetical protein
MEGSYIANVQTPGNIEKKTLITFNLGGSWHPLAAPLYDSLN